MAECGDDTTVDNINISESVSQGDGDIFTQLAEGPTNIGSSHQSVHYAQVSTSDVNIVDDDNTNFHRGGLALVCGTKDANPSTAFTDLVLVTNIDASTVVAQTTRKTPASRTYSGQSPRVLNLQMGADTYNVAVMYFGLSP